MVEGTVKFWNDDEGWGVLTSPEVPGDLWAHFSGIVGTGDRSLGQGERIRFEPEHYPPGQDGYYWRATRVVSVAEGSEFAYLSDEEIEKRITEIDLETEMSNREQGAYRITHRLIWRDSPESEPDPLPHRSILGTLPPSRPECSFATNSTLSRRANAARTEI